VVGIALLLAVGALTLTRAPPRVVRVSSNVEVLLGTTASDAEVCQANEVLPAGVSALRLPLQAFFGSDLRVQAFDGSRVLTEGRRGADWTGKSVTVPITPLNRAVSHVKLCIEIGPNSEPVYFGGVETPRREAATLKGRPLEGRVSVEDLAAGSGSWWSRIPAVVRHMAIGRAFSGTWVVALIAALVAAIGFLAVRLAVRELPAKAEPGAGSGSGGKSPSTQSPPIKSPATSGRRARSGKAAGSSRGATRTREPEPARAPRGRAARAAARQTPSGWSRDMRAALRRVPSAAWACAAIALLNAVAWSLIVPPFEGKDEVAHFAYVNQLAENGTLPDSEGETYSPKEMLVLQGLHYTSVEFTPQTPAIATAAEQRTLTKDVDSRAPLRGNGAAGVATPEPPLYYALATIPYALGGGNVLTKLQLMRLFGALFGAVTALLVCLFLRELLPRAPWAATVGALCVALQPLFAFMSGSVNPDTMLYAVAAGVALCLARALRRGLTPRLAVALGLLTAAGFLTKLDFVGFAIGVFAYLAVSAVHGARIRGPGALRWPAIAAGIGIAPVALFVLRNLLEHHPALGAVSEVKSVIEAPLPVVSYIWQLYLPRLPGMTHYFQGMTTYKDIWFDRSVGLYGWMDTMFPGWVDNVALVAAAAVALLCGRELLACRDALRARLPELGVYALTVVGVLVIVGAPSYFSDVIDHHLAFGEPRYLLPLLPLFGAVVTLAVRGGGRRWMPVVGAAMVVLFFGHDLFSQLQVVARYYG
jgi:Predicted membrane protein (DUF2142)